MDNVKSKLGAVRSQQSVGLEDQPERAAVLYSRARLREANRVHRLRPIRASLRDMAQDLKAAIDLIELGDLGVARQRLANCVAWLESV